jgi:hypothetical protein
MGGKKSAKKGVSLNMGRGGAAGACNSLRVAAMLHAWQLDDFMYRLACSCSPALPAPCLPVQVWMMRSMLMRVLMMLSTISCDVAAAMGLLSWSRHLHQSWSGC